MLEICLHNFQNLILNPKMSSLLIFLFFSIFTKSVLTDPRANQVSLICTKDRATANESATFVINFVASMNAVTPQIAKQRYATVVKGTGNTTVYAFGECMRDLDQTDCNLCFAQCKTQMMSCLPFQLNTRGGRNFLDGCYLRYDYYNFFRESLSSLDKTVCGTDGDFDGNKTVYSANVVELVKNLSSQAVKNDGFFVGSVSRRNASVYGLAQCWKFVTGSACEKCLDDAVAKVKSCVPKKEGRVLNSGCYLRYAPYKFYDNSTSVGGLIGGSRRSASIVAIVCSVVAFVLIVSAVGFIVKGRRSRSRQVRKQLGALVATVNKSKLNYSYETLEKATKYFHASCKLGQGGSGSVYKGVLPDGKVVAIKRLFFNTRQWVDHFFNEVNLISKVDHKNLVKLLGCSITGPESLLVYEYVPNQSLYHHLSGGNNARTLTWEDRYKIILGTAEGLAYLHEESELRIIHRDIKLSNILLEDDSTPRIADFGLARLFPEDKTHISTAIAGTLGYMAPEYVVRGKLTEKADVYSYGVLVIEVVTGRKTNAFNTDSLSVLQNVWNHYGSGTLNKAVDSVLDGNFPEEEATRVLKIGLLCVQASGELRPAMSMVVKLLSEAQEIPPPTQPPFLNSTRGSSRETPHPNDSCSQSSGNSMTQSLIEPR